MKQFTRLKQLALIAAVLLGVLGWVPLVAQAQGGVTLVFDPSSETLSIGETVVTTIEVQAGTQQVDLVEVHLTFDPSVVQVSNAAYLATSQLGTPLVPLTFDNTAGTLDIAQGTFSNFPSGTFDYLEITFEAVGNGDANVAFVTSGFPVTIATFGGANVLGSAQNPGITVEEPAADTTPPVITLNGPGTVNLTVGDTYTEQGATVTDNFDTGLTATISGTVNTAVAETYILTYSATDSSGNSASVNRTVIVSEPGVGPEVVSFTLINADTDQPVPDFDPISDGSLINLDTIGAVKLSIRANVGAEPAGSVVFDLTPGDFTKTESTAPYALNGDSGGNYTPFNFLLDTVYTLTGTPFTGSGGGGDAGTALTISFTITEDDDPQNVPPTANDDSYITQKNQPVNITLTATDPDNSPQDFVWNVGSPSSGSLSGTAPNLTYTPNTDFVGTDSFTYTVSDGEDTSNTATIDITVNDVVTGDVVIRLVPSENPVTVGSSFDLVVQIEAGDAEVNVGEVHLDFDPAVLAVDTMTLGALPTTITNTFDNTAGTIDLVAGILAPNPPQTGTFTLLTVTFNTLAEAPAPGTLIDYAPFVAPRKTDVVSTGISLLDPANAFNTQVVIEPVPNEPPSIDEIANQSVTEGEILTVDINATDPEDDDLTLTAAIVDESANPATFPFSINSSDQLVVEPPPGSAGEYTATVFADDGNNAPAEETFTIFVTTIPNTAPVIASINNVTMGEDETEIVPVSVSDAESLDGIVLSTKVTDKNSGQVVSNIAITPSYAGNGSGSLEIVTDSGDAGEYEVEVTATDSFGLPGQPVSFDLTVNDFVPSDDVFLTLDPATTDTVLNDTFDVTVQLDSGSQPVDALEFTLNFDTDVLQVVGSPQVGSAINLLISADADNNAGTVTFIGGATAPFLTGDTDVMTITFEAVGPATNSPLSFADATALFAANPVLSGTTDGTVTVVDLANVTASVNLQGRPAKPAPSWSVPLTVTLYEAGTSTVAYTFTPTTDDNGSFSLTGIQPGSYDITVKNDHTLRAIVTNVALSAGNNIITSPIPLLEGDANNDNLVNLFDFSIVANAFGAVAGDPEFDDRADFNEDDLVNLADFSLLAANFGKAGADPGTTTAFFGQGGTLRAVKQGAGAARARLLPAGVPPAQANDVVITVDPVDTTVDEGETFTVDVVVEVGSFSINGAEVRLAFDPSLLQVQSSVGGTQLPLPLTNTVDNTDGLVTFAAGTVGTEITGTVQVVTITFEAVGAGVSPLTFLDEETGQTRTFVTSNNFPGLTYDLAGGSVTVNGGVNTPPTIELIADQTVEAGSPTAIGPIVANDDDGPNPLTLTPAIVDGNGLPVDFDFEIINDELVVSPTLDDLGSYTVTITASDGEADSEITFNLLVVVPTGGQDPAVTQLVLVDVDSEPESDISILENGDVLNLATLPAFTIRADVSAVPVGSVVFDFDEDTFDKIENNAPYTAAGETQDGDLSELALTSGSYTLTVTPYTGINGQGAAGNPITVDFTVIDEQPNTAPAFDPIANQMVIEGQTVTVPFVVSDADTGDTVTVTGAITDTNDDPAGFNLTIVNNSVEITPPLGSVGSYTVTLTADDGTDTAMTMFLLMVEPLPQLQFVQNTITFELEPDETTSANLMVSTSDGSDPDVTLTKGDDADWLTLDGETLNIDTTGLLPDVYETSITASADGYISAVLDVVLTVTEPLVTGEVDITVVPPTAPVTEGDVFDVVVTVESGEQKLDSLGVALDFDDTVLAVQSVTPGSTLGTVIANNDGPGTIDFSAIQLGTPVMGTFDLLTITFEAVAPAVNTEISFATDPDRETAALIVGEVIPLNLTPASLTIEPANQAPTIAGIGDQQVIEGRTLTLPLTVDDADEDDLTLAVVIDPSEPLTFEIDGTNLNLTAPLNSEGSYDVTVTVSDGDLDASTTFVLTVLSQPSLTFAPPTLNFSVTQGESDDAAFAVTASDGSSPAVTLSAVDDATGNPPTWLTLSADTATVDASALVPGGYSATVTATADGYDPATLPISLTVTDIPNSAPTIADIGDQQVIEGRTLEVPLTVDDADEDDLTVEATIDPATPVTVSLDSGELVITAPLNSEGSYDVTVTVSDGDLDASTTFVLTVISQPSLTFAPPALNFSVTQGESDNANFAVTASDGSTPAVTFAAVDDATGSPPTWLTLSADTATVDASSLVPGGYSATVTATADGYDPATLPISLTVTDIPNSAPTIADIGDQQVIEGRTLTLPLTVDDADEDDLTVEATIDPATPVTVSLDSGELVITAPLNSEGSYDVTVTVSDGDLDASTSFVLTVISQPSLTFAPPALDFSVTQGESDDAAFAVTASDGSSPAVTLGVIDDATGSPLTWLTLSADTATVDASSLVPGGYSATVTATAAGYDSATLPISLTVTDIPNSAPTIADIGDQQVIEGRTLTLPLTVDDADEDDLTVEATIDPATPVTVSLDGDDLVINAPLNSEGSYDVTVTVSDGDLDASTTFVLTVLSQPSLTFAPPALDFSVTQGESDNANFAVTASDGSSPAVTLSAVDDATGNPPTWLTLSADTATVDASSLVPGGYSATVTATADGYDPATLLVALTVTDIPNSAPTIADIGDQQVIEGRTLTLPLTVDDADEDDLTVEATIDPATPVTVSLDGDDLVINAPLNSEGSYDVTVTVSDGDLDASTTFVLTVLSQPSLTFAPPALDFSVTQGESDNANFAVTASDGSSPAVTLSAVDDATGSPPTWLTLSADTATVDASSLVPGGYSATVTATAAGYDSATLLVALTVTDIPNSAPTIAGIGNQQVIEGRTLTLPLTVDDADEDDLTVEATIDPATPVTVSLDGDDLVINAPLNSEGSYDVTVTVSDGDLDASTSFVLTVISQPSLTFAPPALNFSVTQGESDNAAFAVNTSDGSTPAVTFAAVDDATGNPPTWLTLSADTATVDASSLVPGGYSATVTGSAAGYDSATLLVALTVTPPDVDEADVSVIATGPSEVEVGSSFTYSAVVTNNGPDTAPNVLLLVDLADGLTLNNANGCQISASDALCALGDLSSGTDVSVDFNITATSAGSNLQNFFTVAADLNSDPDNDVFAALLTVTEPSDDPDAIIIGGFVWDDLNGNGTQDAGEPGVEGVEMELLRFDGAPLNPRVVSITDGSGEYRFPTVPAGERFRVRINKPTDWDLTQRDRADDAIDSDFDMNTSQTNEFRTEAGRSYTFDAGLLRPGVYVTTVRGLVWDDANRNGRQGSGEPGISGIEVELLRFDGAPLNPPLLTTTDANGEYRFDAVPADERYRLRVTLPDNWPLTQRDQGNDAIDSDFDPNTYQTNEFRAEAGRVYPFDAGVLLPGTIGDFVWIDVDEDGQQDADEPGLGGVVVRLLSDESGAELATTTTDTNGYYQFDDIIAGSRYRLAVELPEGYRFTFANRGDDTTDSDASENEGLIRNIRTVNDPTPPDSYDVGLIGPVPASASPSVSDVEPEAAEQQSAEVTEAEELSAEATDTSDDTSSDDDDETLE